MTGRAPEPGHGDDAAVVDFYDRLAPWHHLIFADWEASVRRHGAALAAVLAEHGVAPGALVIDAACGIGTQTIGLLLQGYRVRASDLSPGTVRRAREELARRGLDAEVEVADLRALSRVNGEPAPAVIACGNAIPHLLSDDEILAAFRECHRCTAPGGVLVISVRDYAEIPRVALDVHPHGVREEGGRRYIGIQVWSWRGDLYDFSLYLTEDAGGAECATHVMRSTYYAVTIERLSALMREAGYASAERRDGAFYQPLIIGRR